MLLTAAGFGQNGGVGVNVGDGFCGRVGVGCGSVGDGGGG